MNNATCPIISYFDEMRLNVACGVTFQAMMAASKYYPVGDLEWLVSRLLTEFPVTREWVLCLLEQERNEETRLGVINSVYFEILVMAREGLANGGDAVGINEEIDLAVLRLTKQFGVTREWVFCLLDQELGAGTVGVIEADGSVRAMRDDESYTVEAFVN